MTTQKRFLTLAAACLMITALAMTFGLGRLQAQGAAQAEPTTIAVLNIQDVLVQIDENTLFTEAMVARSQAFRAEFESRQAKITQMRNELAILVEGSDNYKEKEMEILNTLIESQTWQQFEEQVAILDQRTHLAALYLKINETAEEIAQQRGIDIVLLDTPLPDFDSLNPEQLLNAVATRKVLFNTEEVDITRSVVEKMNTEWANR